MRDKRNSLSAKRQAARQAATLDAATISYAIDAGAVRTEILALRASTDRMLRAPDRPRSRDLLSSD